LKIICDTREHKGYEWSFGDVETVTKKLDTGDYSLEGFENLICIERKKSPSELAINIGKDSVRFNKELERMKDYKYAYILCEFSLGEAIDFPIGSNIPKSKLKHIRITGKYLVKVISTYKEKYNIDVIYCGDREGCIEKALELFHSIRKFEMNNSEE
jgi:hypothetical protein